MQPILQYLAMRCFVLLCLCFTIRTVTYPQPVTTFSKIFSNYPLNAENGWEVKPIEDGYIVVSTSRCLDTVPEEVCCSISKINNDGDIVWFKQFDFYPKRGGSTLIHEDKIYISGGIDEADSQFTLHCLDMDGNILWNREYGDPNKTEGDPALILTSNHRFVLCGGRGRPEIGPNRYISYLVFADMNGDSLAAYTYSEQNRVTIARTVIESTRSEIVFAYIYCPSVCGLDLKGGLMSIDTSGKVNWTTDFPFSFQPANPHIIQTDSQTLVMKWHADTTVLQWDRSPPALYYLSTAGKVLDRYVFTNQNQNEIMDIAPTGDGGLVGAGSVYVDPMQNERAGWVVRMSADKQRLWERAYRDTSFQGYPFTLQSIEPTSDGGYIAVGTIINRMTGVLESHNWLLKLDSAGCLKPGCGTINIITGTEEAVFLKGKDIRVWPNPTHGPLTVEMPPELTGRQNSRTIVCSERGEQVQLVAKPFDQYNLYDLSSQPAGKYFLIFMVGNEIVDAKKVLKM